MKDWDMKRWYTMHETLVYDAWHRRHLLLPQSAPGRLRHDQNPYKRATAQRQELRPRHAPVRLLWCQTTLAVTPLFRKLLLRHKLCRHGSLLREYADIAARRSVGVHVVLMFMSCCLPNDASLDSHIHSCSLDSCFRSLVLCIGRLLLTSASQPSYLVVSTLVFAASSCAQGGYQCIGWLPLTAASQASVAHSQLSFAQSPIHTGLFSMNMQILWHTPERRQKEIIRVNKDLAP